MTVPTEEQMQAAAVTDYCYSISDSRQCSTKGETSSRHDEHSNRLYEQHAQYMRSM